MKKIVYIGGIFILLVIIFMFAFSHRKQSSSPQFTTTPTPIPLPSNTASNGLAIVNATPADKSTNVNTNQPIVITFNRTIASKDFSFTIASPISYTTSIDGNQFIATPSNPFDPGTEYYYTLQFSDGVVTQKYIFSTSGNGPISDPNYDNASAVNNAGYKILKPDLFLSNQTPYQANDFSVDYHISQIPDTHFVFEVTLTGEDKYRSKQEFLAWLHSLGLLDTQIKQIEFTYL